MNPDAVPDVYDRFVDWARTGLDQARIVSTEGIYSR